MHRYSLPNTRVRCLLHGTRLWHLALFMDHLCKVQGVRVLPSRSIVRASCLILEPLQRNLRRRNSSSWSLSKAPFRFHGLLAPNSDRSQILSSWSLVRAPCLIWGPCPRYLVDESRALVTAIVSTWNRHTYE